MTFILGMLTGLAVALVVFIILIKNHPNFCHGESNDY